MESPILLDCAAAATTATLAVALALAAAAFSGLLRRLARVAFFRFRRGRGKSVISTTSSSFDSDASDSDSGESPSDSEEDSESEDEEEDEVVKFARRYNYYEGAEDDHFSWGGAVVRTWQGRGLRLGLGYDLVDSSLGEPIRSASAGPAALRIWDARTASGAAASSEAVLRRRRPEEELRGGHDGDGEEAGVEFAGGDRGRRVVAEWCRDVVRRFPLLPSPK